MIVRLQSNLDTLAQEQLVRALEESEYIFKHALVQDTAYQSLLKNERRRLHRAIGATLENVNEARTADIADELARHFAEAGENEKTLQYAQMAGDAALRVFAHIEARAHFERALRAAERLPDTRENRLCRVDLVLKMVEVSNLTTPHQNLTRLDQAEQLLNADESPDPTRLAWVYQWRGYQYAVLNRVQDALATLTGIEAVADRVTDPRIAATAPSLMGRLLIGQGQFKRSQEKLEATLDLMLAGGEVTEWLLNLGFIAVAQVGRGNPAQGRAQSARVLELASESNNVPAMATGHVFCSMTCMFDGDWSGMREHGYEAFRLGRASGTGLPLYHGIGLAAWAASRMNDHLQAAEWMTQCNAILEQLGGRVFITDWLDAAAVEIAFNAGDAERAEQLAQNALASAQSVGGIFAEAIIRRVLAQIYAQRRNPERADAEFQTGIELFEQGDIAVEAARTRALWAEARTLDSSR